MTLWKLEALALDGVSRASRGLSENSETYELGWCIYVSCRVILFRFMWLYTHLCMYGYMYVHTYVCTYGCISVCMYGLMRAAVCRVGSHAVIEVYNLRGQSWAVGD